MKFLATTSRERLLRNHWDLSAHGGRKKSLPKTSRPGFVSTVRPDLPQPTHGLKEEDTLGGILYLMSVGADFSDFLFLFLLPRIRTGFICISS